MLDQMFTAENFRRIYDAENRKGLDLAALYFPRLEAHTLAIRAKRKEIREHRSLQLTMATDAFEEQLEGLKNELATLKSNKSDAIADLMEDISQKVLEPSFKIELSQKTGPKGKPVFCIDAEPETFFVTKQLQRNVHRIYGVKQSNRHDLVCQIRDILGGKFPFELVRTDISAFYESIDRKKIIEKLDQDQLLSPSSKKYIKQVFDSYGKLSSASAGIPRGVGISAYLAELFVRPVDHAIMAIPGRVLYCRFVDDIVAVFARPPAGKNLGSYKDRIEEIFTKNGLTPNVQKTSEFTPTDPNPIEFEYLGYRFTVNGGKLTIGLSTAKIEKYRARMNAAFCAYWQRRSVSPRGAYRELVGRIKFLTGNTRLSNNKAQAATGIYFNNSIASDLSSLDKLDKELRDHIKSLKSTKLQKRLTAFMHRGLIVGAFRRMVGFFEKPAQGDPPRRVSAAEVL